ncbi:hypothetical protein XH79_08425 [Bradyrhizobium sp. CCBAU 45389]|nr:hypothetical protein [Bradyrhizobium sp. CCBAU 45389]
MRCCGKLVRMKPRQDETALHVPGQLKSLGMKPSALIGRKPSAEMCCERAEQCRMNARTSGASSMKLRGWTSLKLAEAIEQEDPPKWQQ